MKKASELIEQIFSSLNIRDEKDAVSLFSSWEMLAGSDVASHSYILELSGKTLIVSVDHPGWVQMVQMKKRSILNRIKEKYPELGIERIHTVLG
jgi:predicted nucleic acid-binding Zn ribbon protein